MPRICSSAAEVRRLALGELDERRIGEHRADRAVLARSAVRSRQAASSLGDGAGAWVELVDAGKPLPGGLGVALVGRGLEPAALLARPVEPPALGQPSLELVGELEQVRDVLGRRS